MQVKPWRNEELTECEEALPRLKEGDLDRGIKIVQGKNRSGLRCIPPNSSSGLDKRDERKSCGRGQLRYADVDLVVGSLESTKSGEVAAEVSR